MTNSSAAGSLRRAVPDVTDVVREVTTRLPGRMNATETGYVSATDLGTAAEAAKRVARCLPS